MQEMEEKESQTIPKKFSTKEEDAMRAMIRQNCSFEEI